METDEQAAVGLFDSDADLDADSLLGLVRVHPALAQSNADIIKRSRDFADAINAGRAGRDVRQKNGEYGAGVAIGQSACSMHKSPHSG